MPRRPRGASRRRVGLSLDQLLDQCGTALTDYPELRISSSKFPVTIEGTFVLAGSKGPFDGYDVRIELHDGFPIDQPRLFELGGRIPATDERHIFPAGFACLEVWPTWLAQSADWSVGAVLRGPIRNFLLSQHHFDRTGEWPFGEHAHGDAGQIGAVKALLDPDGSNPKKALWMLRALHRWPKGHNPCLCGSGQRFRDCHRPELEPVRAGFNPVALAAMGKMIVEIDAKKAPKGRPNFRKFR